MNIPLTSINISEEVNKTGIWKQVNEGSSAYKDEKKKKSPDKNR
jgi:sodium bicarbonate transporter 10